MAERKPYSVGLTDKSQSKIRGFKTAKEASAYITTLPGHKDGRYYLDGPEEKKA